MSYASNRVNNKYSGIGQQMGILVDAIHEAGHAVVTAYLRVPLQYATVTPKVVDGFETGGHVKFLDFTVREISKRKGVDAWRMRSAEEISTIAGFKQHKLAIVTADGRAADESRSVERSEDAYGGDESNLRVIAESLGISKDGFTAWRLTCLNQAREVIFFPHVRLAVMNVAFQLTCAIREEMKRVSAKQVRESLRYAEDYVHQNTTSLMRNEAA